MNPTGSRFPVRYFPIANHWCLHSYYTLCPYAPDGSGRILAAGGNLDNGTGEVLILSSDGEVLDRFGSHPLDGGFFHTGWWQTWSPDAKSVYYQAGSLRQPKIARRELSTGREVIMDGDMEGAPPTGEPILSGLMGMLYAAGYGDGRYKPEQAPIPFQERDRHGLFEYQFESLKQKLRFSVAELLETHPQRDRILAAERDLKQRLGVNDGLSLMAYCLRWSHDGSRFLFYFGNHCVARERQEPRLCYVMTSTRDFRNIHLALDLSFDRRGVHWSWQPDGETLIGYGPDPQNPEQLCLAEVRYDGTGSRKLSTHKSGGHPSVSPVDRNLIVTDEGTVDGGAVLFISRKSGQEISRVLLPKFLGAKEPPGRNCLRICHHPVFNQNGSHILCNTLPGREAVLAEIVSPVL